MRLVSLSVLLAAYGKRRGESADLGEYERAHDIAVKAHENAVTTDQMREAMMIFGRSLNDTQGRLYARCTV